MLRIALVLILLIIFLNAVVLSTIHHRAAEDAYDIQSLFPSGLLEIICKTTKSLKYWLEKQPSCQSDSESESDCEAYCVPSFYTEIMQEFADRFTTDETSSSQTFSSEHKSFFENLSVNGNLIRLISHAFKLGYKKQEVSEIFGKASEYIDRETFEKQFKTFKMFKAIKKNKPEKEDFLHQFRSVEYVQQLPHSVIVHDLFGKTGLMIAIESGDDVIFDIFLKNYLDHKCPLDAIDYKQRTALDVAKEKGTQYMRTKLTQFFEK